MSDLQEGDWVEFSGRVLAIRPMVGRIVDSNKFGATVRFPEGSRWALWSRLRPYTSPNAAEMVVLSNDEKRALSRGILFDDFGLAGQLAYSRRSMAGRRALLGVDMVGAGLHSGVDHAVQAPEAGEASMRTLTDEENQAIDKATLPIRDIVTIPSKFHHLAGMLEQMFAILDSKEAYMVAYERGRGAGPDVIDDEIIKAYYPDHGQVMTDGSLAGPQIFTYGQLRAIRKFVRDISGFSTKED